MAGPAPDTETPDALEQRRLSECARTWIAELTASEKAQQPWIERSKKITRLYRREFEVADDARRFAMLWTNVQTIWPATYARPPQPLVSRRFKDNDPTGRAASEVLERALTYSVDKQDLDGVLRTSSLDYVLIGRGTTWERYVPTHGPEVVPPPIPLQVTTGPQGASYTDEAGNSYAKDEIEEGDDGPFYQPDPYQPVVYEESITDYVNWEDFGCSPSRTWDEVTYVWRRVYMDRKQLEGRFGKVGKLVPLDWGPVKHGRTEENIGRKAAIYEIWDKASKRVYWISKSWNSRPLDERDDPLGLDGFFPCPRPLFATLTPTSLNPVPDYKYYEDQAKEIDVLTARISVLEKALKVRGFYAATEKTNLNNMLNADTNVLIPVPEWQTLKDGGGVRGMIEWLPVDLVIQTLQACISARKQLIDDVYQITGIADIMRGESDPRETYGAQKLKGNWGALRVRDKQKEMARFARDIVRIKAEVIAEKFSAETLKVMTGVQLPTAAEKAQVEAQVQQMQMQAQAAQAQAMTAQQPQQPGQPPQMGHNGGPPMAPAIPEPMQAVLRSPTWEDVEALLRNNALRQFRVDIETDSTIEPNETEEKQQTVELLSAISSMVQQWGPALAAQPALAPMVGELIKFALRRFRAGRTLEDIIDSTVDKLVAQAAQAPPPGAAAAPPPDKTPVEVAQLDMATEQLKQQGETQRAMLDAQVQAGQQAVDREGNQLKLVAISRDPYPQGAA